MALTPIEWPANSRVTLCRVTWDSGYKDVVKFKDDAERDAYFKTMDGGTITLGQMTYLKPLEPVTVNIPYSEAYTYNYLVVENPDLPTPGERHQPKLFYFVNQVSYVAPNTTALTLQLDVWTTYINSCEFGRAFVERGHIANAVLYNRDGRDVSRIDTSALARYGVAPEGLDCGSEYLVANHEWFDLSNTAGDGWRLVIVSTSNLAADWGTSSNPNLETATGQKTDGLIGGCNVYAMTADNFISLMDKMKAAPWVSKGIVSIYAFPGGFLTEGQPVKLGGVDAFFMGETPDDTIAYQTGNVFQQLSNGIPSRYHKLHKFFAYPYSCIELTNYTGSPCMYKPQYMSLDVGRANMRAASVAAPPTPKMAFYFERYGVSSARDYVPSIDIEFNTMDKRGNKTLPAGANTDAAVWFQQFPSFTLVNDNATLYLASTVHSRNVSYQGAGWALSKSNASANLSYSQTMQGLDVAQQNKNIENAATVANTALGVVGSLAGGNVGGALSGAASGAIGLASSNMQFANSQNLTGDIAGQNKALATWANKGDYSQAIAAIDASVQDAALTQPSIVGQAGGDGFALANGFMGVEVRYKTIDPQSAAIIGEFWYRFGYAVREFIQMPDLNLMKHFTYWKTSEIYITCARAAEGDKDAIRGIFDKGVTVWRRPEDIGNIDASTNDVASVIDTY